MSYYMDDTVKTIAIISSVAVVIALIIAFICMPIKGYMEVESYHWNWTIDLLEYRQVNESGSVSNHYTRGGAENAARSRIPDDAYNIDVETHSYTKTHHHEDQNGHKYTTTETRYKAEYSYTVDRWVKYTELNSYGKDKSPYEPECDLPADVENPNLGDRKRQYGHGEKYTATGVVNGKETTVIITKDIFDRLTENDEFEYKRHRWNDVAYDIKIAE